MLERLTPAERLAFVLHDIFALPFDEIARVLDRSPEAARQLASHFGQLGLALRQALINGAPGGVSMRGGEPFSAAGFTVRNRRIVAIDILADRERLRGLDLTILDD